MAESAQLEKITAREMEAVLRQYVAAVNDHDVERMLSLRHPDAYLEMMGIAPPIAGRGHLRAFYSAFLAQMPDYRLEVDGTAFGDETGVVWGRFSGTVGDSFMGNPAAGGEVEVPVCFVCSFEDGHFKGDHMYFDFGAVRQQAGIELDATAKERA